jgi:hypothetical protein
VPGFQATESDAKDGVFARIQPAEQKLWIFGIGDYLTAIPRS